MKKAILTGLVLLAAALLPGPTPALARDVPPIVSVEWLQKNLSNPRLVVMDIRKLEDYGAGHIPGAIYAYYGTWLYPKEGKHMEIPMADDLFEAMGNVGIRGDSIVVVVGRNDNFFDRIEAARVLCTLFYGGLANAGILDGGHEEWVRQGNPLSAEFVRGKKTVYHGTLNGAIMADKEHAVKRFGKALFVDVRERVLYSGEKKQEFVARAGHIPGSVNLPASEAYTSRGTFRSLRELEEIASKVVGTDKSKEIITYCDAGKCCPTWAFLLREVLGYRSVRLYDGSFEEWAKDPTLPVTR
jgi:thiosulfate/3-mercaptopyruvate sulfurtransferase